MALENLAVPLERALATLGPSLHDPYAVGLALRRAEQGVQDADPALGDLLSVLHATPELRLFDGLMQVIPGQASRVDYGMLASWLLRRAQEVGAERVLEDLCAFTQATDISVLRISALEGLR